VGGNDQLSYSWLGLRDIFGIVEVPYFIREEFVDWEEPLQFLVDVEKIVFVGEYLVHFASFNIGLCIG
jgi:hypothetical protein